MLTGFRLGIGGAQERVGVAPDLAVLAKAIANGYPLACFCGKGEVMDGLDRTLFTATHNGETISLAAGIATIRTLRDEGVYARIRAAGRQLKAGLQELIAKHSLGVQVGGVDEAPVVHWGDLHQYYPTYEREMLLGGAFCNLPFFIMDAHTDRDISQTLEISERAFAAVARELRA